MSGSPPDTARAVAWCDVCGTRHDERGTCHGRLLATGPERHGRRLAVSSGGMTDIFGVLIAEAGDLWRARVLTYPNMLWSVPGGRGTMKFVGRSPQEAEAAAVAFLREFCARRGFEILNEPTGPVDAACVPGERGAGRPSGAADQRIPRATTVRYGHEKPTVEARTADLSAGGMFVATREPLRRGTTLKLTLEIDGFTIPLAGVVAWTRELPRGRRPVGMGIELTNPPAMYVRLVSSLEDEGEVVAPGSRRKRER